MCTFRACFAVAVLIGLSSSALAQDDRAALIALYESTDGDNWSEREGWKSEPLSGDGFNDDPCSPPAWFGISCEDGRVTEIRLLRNELSGPLPAQLSQLTRLEAVFLSNNLLTGPIPSQLGALSQLTTLGLSRNQLDGSIPAELGDLASLRILALDFNSLSGSLPVELTALSELESLHLNTNDLTGSLPAQLGQLANLTHLILSRNEFTGPIPAELGQLGNLDFLNLSSNQLDGAIPPQLGQLNNLTILNLSSNQLTGAIPAAFSGLASMETLEMSDNQLSGGIPAELGQLSGLFFLNLRRNQLEGPIPTELGQLDDLIFLSLSLNQLSGPIPPEMAQMSNLSTLDLSSNQLSGSIPPELGQLSNLLVMDLRDNQLSGPIPHQLGQLSDLRFLFLSINRLAGPIPEQLSLLTNLDDGNGLNLRLNSLFTDSNVLRAFLNSKQVQGDWESFQTLPLYFAQFADGSGLSSQIVLLNLNDESEASASIEILDQEGQPLAEPLDGLPQGQTLDALTVPASGVLNLRSDGEGEVLVGSVRVTSDRHLVGVVIFGGAPGLAGVGSSPAFETGLRAPLRASAAEQRRTGIAVTDLSGEPNQLALQLLDGQGQIVANASAALPASGQRALFADEIEWDSPVDFNAFNGSLTASSSGALTGTVLETVPSEFVTLPVTESLAALAAQTALGRPSAAAAPRGQAPPEHRLDFAQFADGQGLSSALVLVNLDSQNPAAVGITLKDAQGDPLIADLDSQIVNGQTQTAIAAGGLRVLASDGEGELAQGSAQVTSDRPLAGVIVFSGPGVGSAGVGAGEELPEGFQAPMEANASLVINTGVALMNLEAEENTLDVQLYDAQGQVLAETQITLPAMGRDAIFVNEFAWDQAVDFADFEGSLRVRSSGRLAATVIHTRPGQFATLPVALKPAQ